MISRPRSPMSHALAPQRHRELKSEECLRTGSTAGRRIWARDRVRLATTALSLALPLLRLAAQQPAPAQRGGTPRADTPQLVVGVLTSRDPALGVQAADAIRRRIQNEHTATDLYVVPRPTMDQTLRSSGYNPDSTLGTTDLMALAKQVRSDYALDGTAERTNSGVQTSVRLLTQTGSRVVAEPLAPMIGADFADVAKKVERAVSEAIRALSFYHVCMNAVRMNDYRQAMAAAQQGLRLRPTSAALNVCVLSILGATGATPDSIIAVASVITSVDSSSVIAWANLADAYGQKGDSVRAIDAARMLHRLDPTNPDFTARFVDRKAGAGQFEAALAVLDTALRATPTNAGLLRKRWLLHLRLGLYAEALASGAALVAADSSAATVDYHERQLAAAKAAHDSVSAHRIALEASARFPRNVNFLLVLARDAVDRGAPREALGLAERVLSIEPANSVAWQLTITAHARAGDIDSAVATARRARVAGVPADAVGASLLAVVTPVLSAAQQSPTRANWEAVLRTAQAVDSVASSPRSTFYVGVAAFQIAADEIQSLTNVAKRRSPLRAERQTACSAATHLEDLVRIATIAMPRGGSVDPAIASKILAILPDYSAFVASVKQTNCR
jgi:tetratricopeptide (TPR) repeat protein